MLTVDVPLQCEGPHDFVLLAGGIRLDAEFREDRDDLYGAKDMTSVVAQLDL